MADGVSPDTFKDVFAAVTGAVCVLSTPDVVGRDCALTVTSLTAVSLRPPLALVTVKRSGFLHDALTVSDGWAITVLSTGQLDLARYAARHRYPSDTDDLSAFGPARGSASGAVYFPDGVAAIECRAESLLAAGDHTVAVGRVISRAPDCRGSEPLLYQGRSYRGLGEHLGS